MANGRSKQGGGGDEGGDQGPAEQQDGLRTFLVGLATDPARLGAFIQDPEKEMEAAGIDEADRDILRSGNAMAIHGRITGQTGQAAQSQPPMIILIIDAQQAQAGGAPALSVRSSFPPMIFGAQAMLQPTIYGGQQAGFPIIYPPILPPMLIFAGQQGGIPPMIYPPPMVYTGAEQFSGGGEAEALKLLFPLIRPQLVAPQLVFPQVHPQITPLQVFPQVHPQVAPQITPLQVFPQVHPQIFPQVHPQLVFPQVHPQITPVQLTPLQLTPLQLSPVQLTPLQLTPLQLTPLQLTPLQLVSPQLVSPTLR